MTDERRCTEAEVPTIAEPAVRVGRTGREFIPRCYGSTLAGVRDIDSEVGPGAVVIPFVVIRLPGRARRQQRRTDAVAAWLDDRSTSRG